MIGPRDLRRGFLLVVVLAATGARGETPPTPPVEPASRHHLSPEISQAVAEKLPKYHDPAPPKPAEAPAEPSQDNPDILHLDKLTVWTGKQPLPSEYALMTPKARVELGLRKFPGLRILNIFGLNNGIAAAMVAEEHEVEAKQALVDTVRNTRTDNDPESRRIDRFLLDALARPNMEWAGQAKP